MESMYRNTHERRQELHEGIKHRDIYIVLGTSSLEERFRIVIYHQTCQLHHRRGGKEDIQLEGNGESHCREATAA